MGRKTWEGLRFFLQGMSVEYGHSHREVKMTNFCMTASNATNY